MRSNRLLLAMLFLAALAVAVAGWIVSGVRWLVTAPVRLLRPSGPVRDELPPGRLVS